MHLIIIEMLKLVMFMLVVVGVFLALMIPLSKLKHAAYAVLKRNFFAYFSNPTGYVFLCLFVLLTSLAAFWPHDFFQSNLANLDQLNLWIPLIMLIFVPAITMSIWAEEQRQGTDELLLTMPAGDYDIVLGKYLAAGAIFTASLLFSQLTNFAVLNALTLGDLDTGLFVTTYVGYWLVGLAMVSVGMIASFLTRNLTLSFILGALFNLPLVAAMWADTVIPSSALAASIAEWSYAMAAEEFSRGIISIKAVIYLLMNIAIGFYLSLILIGRRHWFGGRDGISLIGHYCIRGIALFVIAISTNEILEDFNTVRWDTTDEQLSALADDTKTLVSKLNSTLERPIHVEAFISQSLPKLYAKTKTDVVSKLNELKAKGGVDIVVNIHDDLEPFSDHAVRAEEHYDIKPQTVLSRNRGTFEQKDVFMGVVFRCGLEKVVVPFIDHGIPVEYEMVRSICTVADEERLKIGVVKTDAELFGGFQMQGMMPRQIPKQAIIDELEKQYDVVEVDPNNPIVETYQALLAVQPSSLTPTQLDNFIDAIRRGVPTAIFEDPMPVAISSAPPGTSDPRRPSGGGMFGGRQQPPEPKGDIEKLWKLLGIGMHGKERITGEGQDVHVIWQDYNPYPKTRNFRHFTKQFVFVGPDAPGADNSLNSEDKITSGLQQLLFLYPGGITPEGNQANVKFTPLVTTGNSSGYIPIQDLRTQDPRVLEWAEVMTQKRYVLAARIQNNTPADGQEETEEASDKKESSETASKEDAGEKQNEFEPETDAEETNSDDEEETEESPEINVVYVSDIDILSSAFLALRARPDEEVEFKFDNVTFVLNILDILASDDRFVNIRKRQTRHSTLKAIEILTKKSRGDADLNFQDFDQNFQQKEKEANEGMKNLLVDLEKEVQNIEKGKQEGTRSSKELEAAQIRLAIRRQTLERQVETEIEKLKNDRDLRRKEIERELELEKRRVENRFKLWAAVLPPVPPLLIGFIVFVYRRLREREGVSRYRLR